MQTNQLKKYASILLSKGLNLQDQQILVINAPAESEDFVAILTETAYEAGASQVVINWRSDATTRLRFLHEKQAVFEEFPDWRRDFSLTYYHKNAAFLSLVAANPTLMKDVDTQKIMAWQKAQHAALQEYVDGMMASKVTWLVAAVAGKVWANLLFPDVPASQAEDKLWELIIGGSRADSADALGDWDKHLQKLKDRREWMTEKQFVKLHYVSENGTDLVIGLPEGHIWQGGAEAAGNGVVFNANIPTEEIYSAPLRTAVDGIVHSAKPLVYNGSVIDDFSITFKNGKAIGVRAGKGEKILKEMISLDEGAAYLGEIALVPYHSPISLSGILYYETLFDENASCHLAFGKAYPTCLKGGAEMSAADVQQAGLNDSLIHVDFMVGTKDLSITGIQKDGTEVPVFVNGDFAE